MPYADPEKLRQNSRLRTKLWRERHPDYKPGPRSEKAKENARLNRRLMRLEVLAAYGGKCACCGESQHEFLGLDHVNGGGAAHRREVGIGFRFYRWLMRQGCPDDGRFRVLCHNCNMARAFYGRCPHAEDTGGPAHGLRVGAAVPVVPGGAEEGRRAGAVGLWLRLAVGRSAEGGAA